MYEYEFPMAAVAATGVVFCWKEDADGLNPYVLLGKRHENSDAFPNEWCLPGGFLNVGEESAGNTISREIKEECNLNISKEDWTLFYIDDSSKTDLRYNQVVNICYYTLLQTKDMNLLSPGDDIQELTWLMLDFDREYLRTKLAFNHMAILVKAIEVIESDPQYKDQD